MMCKVFEMLKNYIAQNQILNNGINSFDLLELSEDLSYPALLFDNYRQIMINNIYNNLSYIDLNFELILLNDDYDEFRMYQLDDEINNLLKKNIFIDSQCELIISTDKSIHKKQNKIFQINYQMSGVFFYKN